VADVTWRLLILLALILLALILLAWLLPDETHELTCMKHWLSCMNSIRGKDSDVNELV
jgi:hypothetical protein